MRYPTALFRETLNRDVDVKRVFYHPELDVLRFLAFLGVFLHHALPRDAESYINNGFSPALAEWFVIAKRAGAYGVDLFFVLSAYLITELLLREYAKRGSFNIPAFYVRRALRIWPLYFVFLAITVFVVPGLVPEDRFGTVYIVSFALFAGNWVCAANGLPFSVANPLWSISVEEQFYVMWPLLLRFAGVNRIKQLALGMVTVALVTRIVLAALDVAHPAVWCNTFTRLDSIAFGALLAVLLGGSAPQLTTVVRVLLGALGFVMFLLVAKYLRQDGPTSVVTYLATSLASVTLLVSLLQPNAQFLLVWPLSWFVYLGRISYGLYVFHLLALALVAKFGTQLNIPATFESRTLLALGLTILLAAVSYRWLEQPFLNLKRRFSPTGTGDKLDALPRRQIPHIAKLIINPGAALTVRLVRRFQR